MSDVSLSLLVLRTARLDESVQFYQKLGLSFTKEQHGAGLVHYSCWAGNVLIELYPATSSDSLNNTEMMIGFSIKNLDDVLVSMQSVNAKVLKGPVNTQWGRRVVLIDPDGRKVEIKEIETS